MSRLLGLGFLVVASAAAAEPPNGSEFQLPVGAFAEPPDPLSFEPGFQTPRVDYISASGSPERKQGIVAGVELWPNAVVGFGIFDRKGSVRANAPTGKEARVGRSDAPSSPICQPIPLLQQLTRGDPPGGASVREVSAVVAERRGPAR